MPPGRVSVRAVALIGGPLAAAALSWWFGLIAGFPVAVIVAAASWELLRRERRLACDLKQQIDADAEEMRQMRARVTSAEQAQSELRVQARVAEIQRRRFEDILNAFNDAVLVTDTFNELSLANESAQRLLHLTSQARMKPIDEVLGDADLVKLIKDTREGGRALRRHIERQLVCDGRAGTYDVSVSAIADDRATANPDHGVITILRDVTRQKEVDKMKSELVSNVSHELRTPLASIQAYLEMLVDGEAHTDADRFEFYQIMQSEAGRLSRLIENMLNLSRIEAGLMKIHKEPISLPRIIREAFDVLRPQAAVKRIELNTTETPAMGRVMADRDMIFQVVVNLVGNAIKYTPESGRVGVYFEHDTAAGCVRVSVTDTGAGIPEADIPKLFEKFYRVEANARVARGTGLGLSLVRRVVEDLHTGKITVKSVVGKGSTFTFTLPIADPSIGGVA